MVMYDAYERKIKKVAVVKNFIVRFKVFFITLAISIVTLTSGFLGTKGVVTTNVSLPSEIVYGEEIVLEKAKALFNKDGSIYYEFSDSSAQQWTQDVPYVPGKYQVRAVTERSFNSKGYGKPVSFTIKEKNVELVINDTQVEYGAIPTDLSIDLVNGDRLVQEDVSFIFDSVVLKQTQVQANINSIKIVDQENNDVTNRYNITTPKSDITYVEKTIDVVPLIASKVYDGTAISYSNEISETTINALIEGDEITIKTSIKNEKGEVLTSNPKEVGRYTIVIDTYDITNNGVSNACNYKVNLKEANFEITKRDITIATASLGKAFDGTELYLNPEDENNYEASNLVTGHSVVFDKTKVEKVSITHIGTVENRYFYNVLDENRQDVSTNYNITYDYGTLTIYGSTLNVVVDDNLEKTYDQNSFNIEDITWVLQETLPEGYTLVVKESNITDIVNAGTHDYKVLFDVLDSNNQVITDQFIFENIGEDGYYHSTLTINQKEVVVTLNNIEKTYDGYQVLPTDVTFTQVGLLENNEFVITSFKDETATYLYADTYEFNVSYNIIFNNVDVKDNYIVTIDDATITINKETLVIDLVNISKTYDNKEFANEDVKYQVKTNLPDNHQVKVSKISIIGYEETNYPYVGSYEYTASFNVIFNDVDVTDNFDVTVNKAGATIEKFDLTITLLPLTKTYDDGYYVIENLSDVLYYDKTLPENVILKMVTNTIENNDSRTVGSYLFDATFDLTLDGVSVYDNFNVTVLGSSLTITLRESVISTGSEEFVYDGYAHLNKTIEASNLVEGHYVKINDEASDITITDVGTIINNYPFTICDANGNDVTSNYARNVEYGLLEVTPLEITISPVSMEEITYDGESHSYDSLKYEIITDIDHINPEIKDSIVITLSVNFATNEGHKDSVVDAGTYKMDIIGYTFNYDHNFTITTLDDEFYFTIKKFEYTLKDPLMDYELIYGETAQVKQYPLVKDDIIIPMLTYVIKDDYEENGANATQYSYVYNANTYLISYVGCEIIGNKDNYSITYFEKEYELELTISPRTIYVNLYEIDNKAYDGEYISYLYNGMASNFNYTLDSALPENEVNRILYNEAIAFKVEFIKVGDQSTESKDLVKDVGVYTYQYEIILVSGESLNNYVINVMNASTDFEITPRDVTITTNDIGTNEKTYDSLYVEYEYEGPYNFAYDGESIDNLDKQFVPGEELEISVVFVPNENSYSENSYSKIINAQTYNVKVLTYKFNSALDLNNYNLTINDYKQYTIKKKDIEVIFASDEKEYDGEYLINRNYTVDGLASNDYILLSGEDVKVKDVDEGDIENVYNVVIMSPFGNVEQVDINAGDHDFGLIDGYDVTKVNYNLTVISGIIRINPRTVYVKPLVIEDKVYDGDPVIYPSIAGNYDYDALSKDDDDHKMVNEERLYIYIYYKDALGNTLDYVPYNAGNYSIFIAVDEDGIVSSDHYDIPNGKESNYKIIFDENSATSFEIIKRSVTIHGLEFKDKDYDGIDVIYEVKDGNFRTHDSSENEVVTGHKLTVVGYFVDSLGNEVVPNNAGTYYVKIKEDLYTLVDANGNDVLFNYNIILEFDEEVDTFKINPRTIYVNPVEIADRKYNGNYETYQTGFDNYVYAGISLTDESHQMVGNQRLSINTYFVDEDEQPVDALNHNTYYIVIILDDFDVENGLASNYKLVQVDFDISFEILQREIVVTLNDIEDKTYDGLEVYYQSTASGNYALLEGDGLVSGEELLVNVEFINQTTKVQSEIIKNAAIYEMVIDSHSISGTNDVEDNYIVVQKVPHETYQIKVRKLTISPQYFESTYDGFDQELIDEFTYINKGVGYIDDIYLPTIDVDVQAVIDGQLYDFVHNANTYVTKIVTYYCNDETNFDVILQDGEAHIAAYKFDDLKLKDSYEKTYGETLESDRIKGLGDDYILVDLMQYDDDKNDKYIAINVGLYNVVVVGYGYENTLSTNYELPDKDNVISELEIKPLELNVELLTPANNNREYDGKETIYPKGNSNYLKLYDNEGNVVDTLPYGDVIEVSALFYQKGLPINAINAGVYNIVYQGYDIKAGNVVYGNYSIKQYNLDLTYTIKPRTIYINPADIDDYKYTGDEAVHSRLHEYAGISSIDKDHQLVGSDSFVINVYYVNGFGEPVTAKNAGVYYIIIKEEEFDFEVGLASNYNIKQEKFDISFEILQRDIYVTLHDITDKTYDGLEVSYIPNTSGNYALLEGDGLASGEELTLNVEFINQTTNEQSANVKNAAVYKMAIIDYTISGTNDVESNYSVNQKQPHETFEIKVRDLTISPQYFESTYSGQVQEIPDKFTYLSKGEGIIDDKYLPDITVDVKAVIGEEFVDELYDAATYQTKIVSYTCSDTLNFRLIIVDGEAIINPYKYNTFEDLGVLDLYEITYGETKQTIPLNVLADDEVTINILQMVDGQPAVAQNVGSYDIIAVEYVYSNPKLATNYDLPLLSELDSDLYIGVMKVYVELLTPENNNREYDGKESSYLLGVGNYVQLYDGYKNPIDGLPYGDKLEVNVVFTDENGQEVNAINAKTYNVTLSSGNIVSGNLSSSNYDFVQYNTDLTYTIKPRTIYINPTDLADVTYSGLDVVHPGSYEYANISLTDINHQLVGLDNFIANIYYVDENENEVNAKDAATYYIRVRVDECDFVTGLASNYKLIQDNDDISFTIKQIELVVSIDDKTIEFNGYEYTHNPEEFTIVSGQIVDGVDLRINTMFTKDNVDYTSVINVGTYNVKLVYIYVDGEYQEATNYVATFDKNHTVIITEKRLLLIPGEQSSHTYNGLKQAINGEKLISSDSLIGFNPNYELNFEAKVQAFLVDDETNEVSSEGYDYVIDAGTYVIKIVDIINNDKNVQYESLDGELVVKPYNFEVPLLTYYEDIYGDEPFDSIMFETGLTNINGHKEKIGLSLQHYEEDINDLFIAKYVGIYNVIATDFIFENSKASNYILPDLSSLTTTLEIKPFEIHVDLLDFADNGREYDGTTTIYQTGSGNYEALFDKENNQISKLPYDDTLELIVEFYNDGIKYVAKDAKTYDVVISSYKVKDVTNGNVDNKNYIINNINSNETYTINRRKIYISPFELTDQKYKGSEYVYEFDGDDNFVYNTTDPLHQVVQGEHLRVVVTYFLSDEDDEFISIIPAIDVARYGAYITSLEDGTNGKASNYSYTTGCRYFNINPLEIKVSLTGENGNTTIRYDGYDHQEGQFDSYELLKESDAIISSEQLDIKVKFIDEKGNESTYINKAGDYTVVYTNEYEIIGGRANKNNYSVVVTNEITVTIEKLDLYISLFDGTEVTYNGEKQYYTAGHNQTLQEGESVEVNPIVLEFLQLSYEVEYLKDGVQTDYVIDAGIYELVIVNPYCESNESIQVKFKEGEKWYFTVNKYVHTIELNPEDVEYGDELTYEFSNNLLKSDKVTFAVQYYDGDKVLVIPADAKDDYKVVVDETSYVYSEGTNKDNYTILVDDKGYTIDIIPRKVEVNLYQLEDSGREYDGEATVYDAGFNYKNDRQAIDGETLDIIVHFKNGLGTFEKVVDASTYSLIVVDWSVVGGNANKENYEVIFANDAEVNYVIKPRVLKVNPLDLIDDLTYGDLVQYPSYYDNNELVSSNLIGDDKLMIYPAIIDEKGVTYSYASIDGTYFNAGEYRLIVDESTFSVTNENANNYVIQNANTVDYRFKIYPKQLEFEYIEVDQEVYSGLNYSYPSGMNNYKLINGEVIGEEFISLIVYLKDSNSKESESVKDAGTYEAVFKNDWYVTGGNGRKENYEIIVTGTQNTFVINKKELHVRPQVENKVYNGIEQKVEDNYQYINNCTQNLYDIPQLTVDVKANTTLDTILNADNYVASIEGEITGYDPNNFVITRYTQNFKMSPYDKYKITLEKLNVNDTYVYGDIQSDKAIIVYPFDNGSDDYIEVYLSITQNGNIVARPNVGTASYKIDSYIIRNSKESNYTNINVSEQKTVTITKRNITIQLDTITGRYEDYIDIGYVQHGSNDYSVTNGSFAYDEQLVILDSIAKLDLINSRVTYKIVSIGNHYAIVGGNALKTNYNFTFKTGVIVIY